MPMIFFVSIILLFGLTNQTYAQRVWERIGIDGNVSEMKAIIFDENNPQDIYVGGKEGLYKTAESGTHWNSVGSGIITKVNFLYLDAQDEKTVYCATGNGLFKSSDAGGSWQRIFLGRDRAEKNVLALTILYSAPKTIFIATENGIFFSPASMISWQKISGKLNDAKISFILAEEPQRDGLFIVSNKGLFSTSNRLASYERIYSGVTLESEDVPVDISSSEEEASPQESFLTHIVIHNNDLYAGSLNGLILSPDKGKSWQKKPLGGLLDQRINYILLDKFQERIFLAAKNGVYDCSLEACRQIYKGADFQDAHQLAQDREGNLWLASDKGLFKTPLKEEPLKEIKKEEINNSSLFYNEPAIQEIQKEAIRYAEVYPEKIANWRKEARLRAFIPELTLNYDKTISTNVTSTSERVLVGPLDWGVGLKWNVGDFIFSSDQTSIDVRSRLMVELRDDIVNEVTRLYFERKRLQMELAQEENASLKTRAEKELRLEELTALIDGLTGGYLSRNFKKS